MRTYVPVRVRIYPAKVLPICTRDILESERSPTNIKVSITFSLSCGIGCTLNNLQAWLVSRVGLLRSLDIGVQPRSDALGNGRAIDLGCAHGDGCAGEVTTATQSASLSPVLWCCCRWARGGQDVRTTGKTSAAPQIDGDCATGVQRADGSGAGGPGQRRARQQGKVLSSEQWC